jgi:hypothetical protein
VSCNPLCKGSLLKLATFVDPTEALGKTAKVSSGRSNPAAPTCLDEKPFGEKFKWLSPYRKKTYVIKAKVQTEDFEDSALCAHNLP